MIIIILYIILRQTSYSQSFQRNARVTGKKNNSKLHSTIKKGPRRRLKSDEATVRSRRVGTMDEYTIHLLVFSGTE